MQGFETWPQLPTHTIYRGLHHSKIYFRLIRLRSRTQDFLINCTSCGGNIDIVNDCAVTQVQTGQCDGYWGFVFSISPYPSPAFFRHQLSSSPPPQVYLFVIDAAIIIGGRLRLRALFWLVSVLFLIGLIADQKLLEYQILSLANHNFIKNQIFMHFNIILPHWHAYTTPSQNILRRSVNQNLLERPSK